jgi:hypothetical protein
VSDLIKGVLGGGWFLVVGWIVPSAVNVLVFALFVFPSLVSAWPFQAVAHTNLAGRSLILLGVAVLMGLVLMSVQTPLYRLLEGYLWWPTWAATWGEKRQKRNKYRLELRLLSARGEKLEEKDEARLAAVRSFLGVNSRSQINDSVPSTIRRQLIEESIERFPEDDSQIAPTRLGNAIRRLEWYAQDRYCLDSQTLWYELIAIAPEQVRRDESNSRTSVDFYVCLIYGHLVVAIGALSTLVFRPERPVSLGIIAAVLIALTFVWYRLAVAATDEWAAVVRALVNLGRKPLAEALGLELPPTIADERAMWAAVYKLAGEPYPTTVIESTATVTERQIVPGNLGSIDVYRTNRRGASPPTL